MSNFRVIQGCPCNAMIAPYFALLVKDTGATVNSIYRGEDAAAILHRHGKHTQAELYRTLPAGTANPPGRSTHELKSDGVAYPRVPLGHGLEDWQEGIDVNDGDVGRMKARAAHYGWELKQPYKSGVEFHHLNFARRPTCKGLLRVHIIQIRATLPRR
jgi:hypothetical protein